LLLLEMVARFAAFFSFFLLSPWGLSVVLAAALIVLC